MSIQPSGGSIHKAITRVLATGILLVMYAFGMIVTTGSFMAAGVSPAHAQRGRGRGGGRGDGGAGAAIGLGIGAAIIGGAIAAHEAEQAAARDNAIGYCMRRYRSFDPESMTYVGRDGLRRPCP